MIEPSVIREVLSYCWSKASSTKWTPENPAKGQCSPTALVVQDFFGGMILKTKIDDSWHFYNEIDGVAIDFTESQFKELPKYLNLSATREEALSDCTIGQYKALREQFEVSWKDMVENAG